MLNRWKKLDAPILVRIKERNAKLHFWQCGGYDRNIVTSDEFEEKLNYIHNNPVSRGLVENTADWRWSSASWYAGQRTEALISIDSTGM